MEGINIYGKGVRNVYSKGTVNGCYVEINNVQVKGRVYGYQIVHVDNYDRLTTKCRQANITLFWLGNKLSWHRNMFCNNQLL